MDISKKFKHIFDIILEEIKKYLYRFYVLIEVTPSYKLSNYILKFFKIINE